MIFGGLIIVVVKLIVMICVVKGVVLCVVRLLGIRNWFCCSILMNMCWLVLVRLLVVMERFVVWFVLLC